MGLGVVVRGGAWVRAKTGTGFKGCGLPTPESLVFWASSCFQTGAGQKVTLPNRCLLSIHPGLGPGQRRPCEALQDPKAGHWWLLHHSEGPV